MLFRSLGIDSISNFRLLLPSILEQKQIADFLDKQTTKIDSEISKNQKLIELLKEKRQSAINHAVTKGLDPAVPMKDSGIEWVGEMPEHWEILRMKLYKNKNKTRVIIRPPKFDIISNNVSMMFSLKIYRTCGSVPIIKSIPIINWSCS